MTEPEEDGVAKTESLDPKTRETWIQLAGQVAAAPVESSHERLHESLEKAAESEPQSPVAPAYRLWIADNLGRDGRYSEAVKAYDKAVEASLSARRLVARLDPAVGAMYHKAQAAALDGDSSTAVGTYQELGRLSHSSADPFFRAGILVETNGDYEQAADFYRKVASSKPSHRTDDPAELARRALLRLEDPQTLYVRNVQTLVDQIETALGRQDRRRLDQLVSKTHFAVGPLGGHTAFESMDLLEELYRDLQESEIVSRRALVGSGGKRYLFTTGWRGRWFQGEVAFILNKAPQGWQWTGLGITHASDPWLERWRPAVKETNQPLPFELFAPWPADLSFTTGGLIQYIGQQAAVVAAQVVWGTVGGSLLAWFFSRSECGFGPRGLYYNQEWTHVAENAFAIDFTRYRPNVPYEPESAGTPVLAARSGIVVSVRAGAPSGDESTSNTVEIIHGDPSNPADEDRFRSRYLHLEGPFNITVSEMMPIFTGNRLGRMDDTGNSVLNHLHFSIHDRNIPHPQSSYGASVRPTPMSGVRLEDGDSGTCVRSTNIERIGEKPMIEVTTFAGQNWLITPAATAANQTPPARIEDQKWLLVLSGVGIVDLKGNSGAQWLRETVSIRPYLTGPLDYAIEAHSIPRPAGTQGLNYWTEFQVEQWAPFAAMSSIFNEHESVNSGFAVDTWRPNPFWTGTDFSNEPLPNLFAGIQVDVAVRDIDAWLYRVSYNISLVGKIVFGPVIIT